MYKIFVRWNKNQLGEPSRGLHTVEIFRGSERISSHPFTLTDPTLTCLFVSGVVQGIRACGAIVDPPKCLFGAVVDMTRED
ncbi:MAG: hypothetical protein Q7R83_04300 [bacterium]|nr:hypothetical protein [bacterium]